jgi:hypothetical protein
VAVVSRVGNQTYRPMESIHIEHRGQNYTGRSAERRQSKHPENFSIHYTAFHLMEGSKSIPFSGLGNRGLTGPPGPVSLLHLELTYRQGISDCTP